MQLLEEYGMPIEAHSNGDSMLWAGLMMAVGATKPAQGIQMCQTPDGRLWRTPSRVNNQPQNGFSRDMALGFLLYVQASGDYAMADKWTAYIKSTRGLFPASESTDTRNIITPGLWWAMSYVGIKVPLAYRLTRSLLRPYNKLELVFTPRGYETHLKAVTELILVIRDGKRNSSYGQTLLNREPNNPFFMWLAGKDSLAITKNAELKAIASANPGAGTQWAWQRTDSEEAWRDSMGWDFLFIEMLCKMQIP
jgi:hypothetical protein